MSNEHFFEEEQFVISPELLHILHWLMKYEEAALSELITQAYYKGFEEKIKKQNMFDEIEDATNLQNSVVDFLNLLENHITMLNNQSHTKTIVHPNVMDTLDRIDPKHFDFETIKSTVMATAEKIRPKNNNDAKKMFLKELLKQWEPKQSKDQKMILN
ncbi:hypothetical protein HYV10_03135 [Candidatus Dependentiae bacterium]|nr:hypothetical protein [Candidatus Dependentiae bacterium]